jgi:hypothetical protein
MEELIKGGVTSGKRPPLGSCSRSGKIISKYYRNRALRSDLDPNGCG